MQIMQVSDTTAETEPSEGVGRRELKIRAAKARVERAAVDLALEHGVDGVTVEDICDVADISPRTFYNYFGSREAALIGEARPMPDEAEVQAYVDARGVGEFEAFVGLMARLIESHAHNHSLLLDRRRLIDSSPQLAALNLARATGRRDQYAAIVERRLEATDPDRAPEDRSLDARLIVGVATGALHVASHDWLTDGGDRDPADFAHDVIRRVRRIVTERPTGATS
jgi:AcrR family transcriptional regulator